MSGWQLAANLPVLEEAWAGGAHSGVVSNEKQWISLGMSAEERGVEWRSKNQALGALGLIDKEEPPKESKKPQ